MHHQKVWLMSRVAEKKMGGGATIMVIKGQVNENQFSALRKTQVEILPMSVWTGNISWT